MVKKLFLKIIIVLLLMVLFSSVVIVDVAAIRAPDPIETISDGMKILILCIDIFKSIFLYSMLILALVILIRNKKKKDKKEIIKAAMFLCIGIVVVVGLTVVNKIIYDKNVKIYYPSKQEYTVPSNFID